MLNCTGSGFTLYKLASQPELNKRVLYGSLIINNGEKKNAFWKAIFIETAFDVALYVADGTYIDIINASIFTINNGLHNSNSYVIKVREAAVTNITIEAKPKNILYVSTKSIRILELIGVDSGNKRIWGILGTNNPNGQINNGLCTWHTYFKGKAFEDAKLLKD